MRLSKQRDYTPPPLAYPYEPLPGPVPYIVQDRLAFAAFKSRQDGKDLGYFMVKAWEEFRYPHIKMLYVLLDMGYVRRVVCPIVGPTFDWVSVAQPERPQRSEDAPDCATKPNFFDVNQNPEFSASVVVAPKISPMGWTA